MWHLFVAGWLGGRRWRRGLLHSLAAAAAAADVVAVHNLDLLHALSNRGLVHALPSTLRCDLLCGSGLGTLTLVLYLDFAGGSLLVRAAGFSILLGLIAGHQEFQLLLLNG